MIQPDILYKIHMLLFKERTSKPNRRFGLEEIDEKFRIGDLEKTKEHCEYLELTKYLIKNINYPRENSHGYEQIQPGNAVIFLVFEKIMEKLENLHDDKVDLILKEARGLINIPDVYVHLAEEAEKYKDDDKVPIILKTIHNEYWTYLKDLQVFQIEIDPHKLDVTKSDGFVKISGIIHKAYQKANGKILFRISLLGFKDEEEMDGYATFVKGTIVGDLKFSHGFQHGEHDLYGYFQLEGEKPPNRYDAYAKSDKIKIKIISNN